MTDLPPPVAEALGTLYAASPEEFIEVRRRLVAAAREHGDQAAAREIGLLRKPSVAGWTLNTVARAEPERVQAVLDLGERMRAAQGRLDAATLTALRPERDAVVAALVSSATALAADRGRTLSASVLDEIRSTVVAALADAAAAQALASGQLTRSLSYSGFGEVDLSEAVARTTSGAVLTVLSGAKLAASMRESGAVADATSADSVEAVDPAALQRAVDEAQRRVGDAELAVAQARERAEDTRERLATVERQLAKAREADERAREAVTSAVRDRRAATQALADAQDALRSALRPTP